MEKKRPSLAPILIAALVMGGVKMCNTIKENNARQEKAKIEVLRSIEQSMQKYRKPDKIQEILNDPKVRKNITPKFEYEEYSTEEKRAYADSVLQTLIEAENQENNKK